MGRSKTIPPDATSFARTCLQCGATFTVERRRTPGSYPRTCSAKCSAERHDAVKKAGEAIGRQTVPAEDRKKLWGKRPPVRRKKKDAAAGDGAAVALAGVAMADKPDGRATLPAWSECVAHAPDELEFLKAVDRYKRERRVRFPTLVELLRVLKDLGYRKAGEARAAGAA